MKLTTISATLLMLALGYAQADDDYKSPFAYDDPAPKRYNLAERASKIDPRCKSHPEINFILEKDGQAKDTMNAAVDTRVKPRGKMVVSLMGGGLLFDKTASYGMHAIRVPFAAGWFNLLMNGKPKDTWRGDIRLEAAIGEDVSSMIDIPKPDSMMERAHQMVKWLAKENPQGKWEYFLTEDGKGLRWDDVIVCGLSHGATTAARFAQHTKLDRVLCFSGPRDQDQSWQSGPSATPSNRYFCFTAADSGWREKHYCRSWELMGLHEHGPIVDVEMEKFPYGNTRRLYSSIEEKNSMKIHNGVAPNGFAFKDAKGGYLHDDVWRYMFTHPVDKVGAATPLDPMCQKPKK
jgi:hypothetical protein